MRAVNLKKGQPGPPVRAARGGSGVQPGVHLPALPAGGDPFGIQDKVAWLLERIPALAGVAQAVTDFVSKYLLFITNALVVLVFLVGEGHLPAHRRGCLEGKTRADAGHLRLVLRVRRGVSALVFQERWKDFRGLMKAFWLAATLAAMVLMALSQQFPHWGAFAALPIPVSPH